MKNSFPKSENEINLSGLPKSEKIAKEVLTNESTKNTVDILIKKIDPS